jgi:hypothetical protein
VDGCIREQFQLLEQVDHTAFLEKEERLGYQSVHYLVRLTGPRTRLPEYQRFDGFIAEIQVRTVLQHAWAEIEHDIQYKSAVTIPTEIRRRFMALAGLLEIADREFQQIQDYDEVFRQEARESVEKGELEKVEITPDALRTNLDRRLGPDSRMSDYSYEWTARVLKNLGFVNLQELDDCIADYNDDQLNKFLYPTRQGQLTRFEYMLLAALGEAYIDGHPFRNHEWWRETSQERLKFFGMHGITTGKYVPANKRKPTLDPKAPAEAGA